VTGQATGRVGDKAATPPVGEGAGSEMARRSPPKDSDTVQTTLTMPARRAGTGEEGAPVSQSLDDSAMAEARSSRASNTDSLGGATEG